MLVEHSGNERKAGITFVRDDPDTSANHALHEPINGPDEPLGDAAKGRIDERGGVSKRKDHGDVEGEVGRGAKGGALKTVSGDSRQKFFYGERGRCKGRKVVVAATTRIDDDCLSLANASLD
jgi:hypothetical protein